MSGVEIALLAGTTLSAASSIKQGQTAAAAADFQRQQVEEQKEVARLERLDTEVQRRRRLDYVLGQQRTQRAAFGLQSDSPSFMAAQARERETAEDDLRAIKLQGALQQRQFGLQSDQLKLQSSSAMQSGIMGAGGSLLSGIGSMDFGGPASSGSNFDPAKQAPPRKPSR